MKFDLIYVFAAMLVVAGCGEKPQQTPPEEAQPAKLFEAERDTLEKSREVEQVMEKQAEELRQQVEQQEK